MGKFSASHLLWSDRIQIIAISRAQRILNPGKIIISRKKCVSLIGSDDHHHHDVLRSDSVFVDQWNVFSHEDEEAERRRHSANSHCLSFENQQATWSASSLSPSSSPRLVINSCMIQLSIIMQRDSIRFVISGKLCGELCWQNLFSRTNFVSGSINSLRSVSLSRVKAFIILPSSAAFHDYSFLPDFADLIHSRLTKSSGIVKKRVTSSLFRT